MDLKAPLQDGQVLSFLWQVSQRMWPRSHWKIGGLVGTSMQTGHSMQSSKAVTGTLALAAVWLILLLNKKQGKVE